MVQLPLFHPEPQGTPALEQPINSERPFFLFVGRLEKIKGVQTLIPVFRRLKKVDLVIAGRNGRNRQRLKGLEPDSMRETRWLLPVAAIPLHLRHIRLERASS